MFAKLHQLQEPLLLCNVWDAASAKLAESLGYQAIGTSSAAIAATLGREDGENISFDELFFMVGVIKRSSSLPLTVDIESGYAENVSDIVDNIKQLAAIGIQGINIEDSCFIDNQRCLSEPLVFAQKLKAIRAGLDDASTKIFINARIDTYIMDRDDALDSALQRIKHYQKSGADGIFIPCIKESADILSVVKSTKLPINVMCIPELADFSTLKNLGVKRISMGNFVHGAIQDVLSQKLAAIVKESSFNTLFD